MEKGRIKVTISDDGTVSWARGGEGISVREFVDSYPCQALRYLTGGGRSNQFGEAVLGALGGLANLQEFNRTYGCGEEENLIQQV